MGLYPKLKSTSKGRELIARASATGKGIEFTKVVTGDGNLTTENIDTMNAIIAPKLELPVTPPGKFIGDGQFQVEFAMSNANVNNGFYAREIGIYAKLVGESDSSAKLVAYTNGGNFVDYIPSKETPINSKVFQVDVNVGDAEVVTVKRIDAAYLTQGAMEVHNADNTAHNSAFSKHNNAKDAHPQILEIIKVLKGTSSAETRLAKNLLELINLVGMGGIVAAKLDANAGFVKFANGLIIQWVWSTVYGATEMQYPIKFKSWCIPVFIHRGNDNTVNVIERYDSDLTTLRLAFNHQTSNEFRAIIIGV